MKVKSIKIREMNIRRIKRAAVLVIAAMGSLSVQAQDTTSFKKYESRIDSLETLLAEGEYGTGICANFTFAKFVLKENTTKENAPKAKKMYVHGSGLFWGFSNLSSQNLSNIGEVDGAILDYFSNEIGWTMFGMDVRMSKKRGWFLFAGLGLRANTYHSDLNTAFKIVNNKTVQVPADNGYFYSKSKLRLWYLHIPIMFEYQKKSGIFFQAGAECGINFSSKSKAKSYLENSNKKIREKETLGKGMHVNPFTVDLKAEIGFNDFAIYARYGLIDIFRKGRGPEAIPVSAGIIWHF
jgi:hypothetical protein